MSQIKNHLVSIRDWMSENNIDALIIPHEDEYLSEYIPPECERLAWATGFTGSAGAAVILKDKAAIFVDGRYTVQVRNQVDESLFTYKHLVSEPYLKWIQENTNNGARVGYDARLHRANWVKLAKKYILPDFIIIRQNLSRGYLMPLLMSILVKFQALWMS